MITLSFRQTHGVDWPLSLHNGLRYSKINILNLLS